LRLDSSPRLLCSAWIRLLRLSDAQARPAFDDLEWFFVTARRQDIVWVKIYYISCWCWWLSGQQIVSAQKREDNTAVIFIVLDELVRLFWRE
jgi:hypothetical protein